MRSKLASRRRWDGTLELLNHSSVQRNAGASNVGRTEIPAAGELVDGSLQTATGLHVVPATSANHHIAWWLLRAGGHPVSWDSFHAVSEMPQYVPTQRLLACVQHEAVGHLRLVPCHLFYGNVVIPSCILTELVVRPEWDNRQVEQQLVEQGFRRAVQHGACLVLLATDRWRTFLKQGWLPGLRHCYTRIEPRRLLAHLRRFPRPLPDWWDGPPPAKWTVRQMRRADMECTRRLYQQGMLGTYGPIARTPAQWHWLLEHDLVERVYVAEKRSWIHGADEPQVEVHGYMVIRDGQIVELLASSASGAWEVLATRAADEAIESDWHELRFDAPSTSSLHTQVCHCGGQTYQHDVEDGVACLMKPASLPIWIAAIQEQLLARAKQHGVPTPLKLHFMLDSGVFRLTISEDSVSWQPSAPGPHGLKTTFTLVQAMFLGCCDPATLVKEQKLHSTSSRAVEWATALFPELAWWKQAWHTLIPGY